MWTAVSGLSAGMGTTTPIRAPATISSWSASGKGVSVPLATLDTVTVTGSVADGLVTMMAVAVTVDPDATGTIHSVPSAGDPMVTVIGSQRLGLGDHPIGHDGRAVGGGGHRGVADPSGHPPVGTDVGDGRLPGGTVKVKGSTSPLTSASSRRTCSSTSTS